MSHRLHTIANMIEKGMIVADIGSDHAYLPCFLVLNNICAKAYACDIADGPLSYAINTINKYQLSNKIEIIKSNGLTNVLKKDINGLVLSGMGGHLISEILGANNNQYINYLSNLTDLYLQPNNAELLLRKWLVANNWQIVEEKIIKEDDRYYEIIHAQKGKVNYTKNQLMFGPFLLLEKNNHFKEKWQKQLIHYQKIAVKVTNFKRLNEIEQIITLIKEVLNDET